VVEYHESEEKENDIYDISQSWVESEEESGANPCAGRYNDFHEVFLGLSKEWPNVNANKNDSQLR